MRVEGDQDGECQEQVLVPDAKDQTSHDPPRVPIDQSLAPRPEAGFYVIFIEFRSQSVTNHSSWSLGT